jgi:IclR family transcriptional regulator, acetate operon repressor
MLSASASGDFCVKAVQRGELLQHRAEGFPVQGGGGVKSLTRALSILVALAECFEGLTLAALSKRLSLPPSTAHRLLTTLQRQRFVRFDSSSMSWRIGVQAFTVGSAFAQSSDVVALAKPYMRRLMEETGETINLYVLSGDGAICMAQVQSPQMIRAISRPGGALRMHRSAAGKAMLAHMPKDQVADIVMKHGLPRATQNTIVSMRKLEADLAKTRERGFAIDNEEFILGLRCVAAPLLDERGTAQAALSVAGPKARMTDERLATLGKLVAAAAYSATAELGGGFRHEGS